MPPLKVEYAKSGRSRCANKQCAEIIEKGELRIGTGNMMPGMDEYSYKWRHLCCFTKRQLASLNSVDQLDGYDDVKADEQPLLIQLIKGELIGKDELKANTGDAGNGDGAEKVEAALQKNKKRAADDNDEQPAKKKAKKDPLKPKNPKNAFMFYLQEQLPVWKEKHPGKLAKDLRKEIAVSWDELEDEKGKPYREQARKDKKRYEEEMAVYSPPASPVASPVGQVTTPQKKMVKKKKEEEEDDTDEEEELLSSSSSDESDEGSDDTDDAPTTKPPCKYGASCYRSNPQHLAQFSHPPKGGGDTTPQKKPIKKKKFVEDDEVDDEKPTTSPSPSPPPAVKATPGLGNVKNLPVCPYGILCCRTNSEHKAKFYHPSE